MRFEACSSRDTSDVLNSSHPSVYVQSRLRSFSFRVGGKFLRSKSDDGGDSSWQSTTGSLAICASRAQESVQHSCFPP